APVSDRVVYRSDQDLDDVFELFSSPLAGGGTTKLSPPLAGGETAGDVTGFALSADGSRAIYRADQDYDDTYELYGVSLPAGAPEKINGDLVRGGDVTDFALTRDGSMAIYIADQEVDETFELYGRMLDGGALVKLS